LWQFDEMTTVESSPNAMFNRLVDSLYVDAMVLADEARAYFDRQGTGGHSDDDCRGMDVMGRLSFTCESLKVTTRLMHIIAWLLTQRAWQRGEISRDELADPKYRLGEAAPTEPTVIAAMPAPARALVKDSLDLYARVLRLQDQSDTQRLSADTIPQSPARHLMSRLENAF
jgi:regulator of CtrA degradation